MRTPKLDELLAKVFPHSWQREVVASIKAEVAEDIRDVLATVSRQHRGMAKLVANSLKMDNSHVVRSQTWDDAAESVDKFAKKEET